LETRILLSGDLDYADNGRLREINNKIAKIERMLKALIKSLESKPYEPLNPRTLFSNKIGEEPHFIETGN
jgi:hypothetical protein